MSRFARRLAEGSFVHALEITPPRDWRPAVLRRRAMGLGGRPDAVAVIQRGGRVPSLAASRWLARQGFEPIWHLVTHGRSRRRIEAEIARAEQAGLCLALCLRGDHGGPAAPDGMLVRQAVAAVRAGVPGALVGVSFDPYARPERALRWLETKLDAGAGFIETQPVFDPDVLGPVADEIAPSHPGVFLIPMLIPLFSPSAATRLERRLRIPVPEAWHEALRRDGTDAGWRLFEESLARLRSDPRVAGVTIMTFEMDPPPAVLERLASVLEAGSSRTAGSAPARASGADA
jgi:5,10-methylenetetrahydrofolate reductase